MRILVLTSLYPPHHYGGYELNCQAVVERFVERGHEVAVLASDHERDGVDDQGSRGDVPVARDLQMYWADHRITRPSPRACLRVERHNERAIREAIERSRPDVLSAWQMGALSLGVLQVARELGVPIVHVVHDDWPVYAPQVDGWLRWCRRAGPLAPVAERAFGVHCHTPDLGSLGAFCFISDASRAAALSPKGAAYPLAAVTYCGISDDFGAGPSAPERPFGWRILCPGRIDPRKGLVDVVEALAELPDQAVVRIDGPDDGTHRDEILRLARRLGVEGRVEIGVSSRPQLVEEYRRADVVAFTPRWPEPFGLVPVEAMASGTAVIATATGGSAEFLFDESNCLRVPLADPPAIAAAVRRLATDDDLRRRLRAEGFATAAELTLEHQTDHLERWHEAAASGYAAGVPAARPTISTVLGPSGSTD